MAGGYILTIYFYMEHRKYLPREFSIHKRYWFIPLGHQIFSTLSRRNVKFLDPQVTSKDCTLSIGFFTKPDDTS